MKDKEIILSIITNCENIIKYMKNVKTHKQFEINQEKVDSVLFNFIQIGEKTKRLRANLFKDHPHISPKAIIGLINMVTHDYEGVTLEKIYLYCKKEIPILKSQLTKLVKSL